MDLKKVHEVVNKFQRNIFKSSSYINAGFFASSFKGAGLQFKEHQIYNYGDEVRFIDWKLLARKNTPYIKTFEEERNIEVKIIIDVHSNLLLCHKEKSKMSNILEMIAVLILFAGKTKDYVSCYFVGTRTLVLKKLSGENGLLKLMSSLISHGLISEDGKPLAGNINGICINEFSERNYSRLLEIQKGPFVLFSVFDDDRYTFFKKIYGNKNTHFFNLKCPFEKELGRYQYFTSGLRVVNRLLDEVQHEKRSKVVTVIDVENSPLVNFVEGIMSNDKRV